MRKVRGVTLMEVLVAMVLVAIISVTVYVSLSGSTQDAQVAWSANKQDELQSQLDILWAAARQEVAEADLEPEYWYAEAVSLGDGKDLASTEDDTELSKATSRTPSFLKILEPFTRRVESSISPDFVEMYGLIPAVRADGPFVFYDPAAAALHPGLRLVLDVGGSTLIDGGVNNISEVGGIAPELALGLEWILGGVALSTPSLAPLKVGAQGQPTYDNACLFKLTFTTELEIHVFDPPGSNGFSNFQSLYASLYAGLSQEVRDEMLGGDLLAELFAEGSARNKSLMGIFDQVYLLEGPQVAELPNEGEGGTPSETTDAGNNPGDGAGTNPDGGAGSDPGQGSGGTVTYPYTETDAYGTTYTYYEDGSYSYQDQYGNSGQYYADGSYYHKYSDGTKETYSASTRTYERFGSDNSYTFSQTYEDGSSYYYNTSSYGTSTSRHYADGSSYYSSETDYSTSTSSYSADGSYSSTYRTRDGYYSESSYDASDGSSYSYNEYSDGSWTTFSSGLRENGDSYSYTEDSSGYWSTTESGQAGNDSWSVSRNSNGYYSESHNGTDKNGSYSYTSTQGVSYSGVSFSEYSSSRTDLNGFSSGSGYISYADGSYSEYEWDDSGYNYSWSQNSKGNWYSYNYGTNYYNSSWGDNNQSSNYGYGTTSSGMQYTESGSYTSDPYYYTYSTTYEVSGTASYTTGYDGRTNYYVYNDGKNTYNYSSYINPDIFLNGKVTTSGVTYYFGANGVIFKEDAKGNLIVHMQPT